MRIGAQEDYVGVEQPPRYIIICHVSTYRSDGRVRIHLEHSTFRHFELRTSDVARSCSDKTVQVRGFDLVEVHEDEPLDP
jgi:hypothetical protein